MEWILEYSQFGMELLLTMANLIIFSCDTIYLALKLEHLDLAMMGQFLGRVWEPALVTFTPRNFKSISQIARDRIQNWLGGQYNVCTALMEVLTLSLIQVQLRYQV